MINTDELQGNHNGIELLEQLRPQQKAVNTLPLNILPPQIQDYIKEAQRVYGLPLDYLIAGALHAASTAIGNCYRVKPMNMTPQPCSLYMLLVGSSAAGKSPAMDTMYLPILEHNEHINRSNEEKYIAFKQAQKIAKESKDITQSIDEPQYKKLVIQDFTLEYLMQAHSTNPRGLVVYPDEGLTWIGNIGKYNAKGNDDGAWLSFINGNSYVKDRVSQERQIAINKPFVNVIAGITRGVITNELSKDNRGESGFIYRICFVIPYETKKPYLEQYTAGFNEGIKRDYVNIFDRIFNTDLPLNDWGNPSPKILSFSSEANNVYISWNNEIADKINNEISEEGITSIITKMQNFTLRFALILQVLHDYSNQRAPLEISADTLKNAIQVGEYFINTALQVYDIMSGEAKDSKLSTQAQRIYNALPPFFNTADGLEIAEGLGMPKATFSRLLKKQDYFTKVKHGEYKKNK